MEIEHGTLALDTNTDMVACRHDLREMARELGFSPVGLASLVAAVGELGSNTLAYGGGQVSWEIRREEEKIGLRMTFEARGPAKPGLVPFHAGEPLRDTKRLVHEFASEPDTGSGTRVIVTCWR